MATTPFAIEAGVCLFFSVILQCMSLRQIYHDIIEKEKWRPLIVCHWLMEAASIWQVIGFIDGQGGLGVYSQAFILFVSNVRSVLLFAACRTLASSFIASYQLMTQGPTSRVSTNLQLAIGYAIIMGFGLILFFVLLATGNAWVAIVSRFFLSGLSVLVSTQIVSSSWKVRKILVDEHKRTQKYSEGIKKLTRLIVLVCLVFVVGNMSLYVGLTTVIDTAKTVGVLSEAQPLSFSYFRIFSDVVGLVTVAALIMGSWKIKPSTSKSGGSKGSKDSKGSKTQPQRTTRSSTTAGKSSPKGTSRESPTEGIAIIDISPQVSSGVSTELERTNLQDAIASDLEAGKPAQSSPKAATASGGDDNSSKGRRKRGYQELEVA